MKIQYVSGVQPTSHDYASSKWCLEELVKIIEHKEAGQQIVIPIFYHVDPSDVRHQKYIYKEAFTHHEQKLKDNMQNLQIWRSVLKKTVNLSGYHPSNFQDESELINAIVENVLRKLEDNIPIVLGS
ncbi:TMV resistance protein N-like [Neltuma alba]|uniref:TMV resistance protein N-like n=1 Tax=Neltuma alba TaxID=207710 RepID=UPI0010A2C601|nr:TMV resistance protein N-like [Prosopis alba]